MDPHVGGSLDYYTETAKYRHSTIGAPPKDQACIFPVKVYDSKGILKRIISVEELSTRKTSKKDRFHANTTRAAPQTPRNR